MGTKHAGADVDTVRHCQDRPYTGKGDRVGIWGPNMLEWMWTQFATARIGLILVRETEWE